MSTKPKIFIASSVESLKEAEAVNSILDYQFEVNLWVEGTFRLSSTALPDLIKKSSYMDFAIFIFTPDDLAFIREKEHQVARDNVVFELGLFIGAIGIERSFVIQPRGTVLRLPSDLAGITTADYEPERADGDISSAMNSPCTKIKSEIGRLGVLDREFISSNNTIVANPSTYEITDIDIHVLAVCLHSRTSSASGYSFFAIAKDINEDELLLRISSIKLQRMGLIEIEIVIEEQQNYTDEYFGHKITELGIDFLLSNEKRFVARKSLHLGEKTKATNDLDEKIPF